MVLIWKPESGTHLAWWNYLHIRNSPFMPETPIYPIQQRPPINESSNHISVTPSSLSIPVTKPLNHTVPSKLCLFASELCELEVVWGRQASIFSWILGVACMPASLDQSHVLPWCRSASHHHHRKQWCLQPVRPHHNNSLNRSRTNSFLCSWHCGWETLV